MRMYFKHHSYFQWLISISCRGFFSVFPHGETMCLHIQMQKKYYPLRGYFCIFGYQIRSLAYKKGNIDLIYVEISMES